MPIVRRSKLAILCALTLFLIFAPPAMADEYANVHSVAVIVSTGDDITIRKLSLLSFTEWTEKFTAQNQIADSIKHYVETALAKRFEIRQVDLDLREFYSHHWDSAAIDMLKSAAAVNHADAIVFVGLGLHTFGRIEWTGIGLDEVGDDAPATTLYTYLTVAVIDARTGKEIDRGRGRFPHGGPFGGVEPLQVCDGTLWPGHVATMTPDKRHLIETEVMAAIKGVIPFMLDDAELPNETGYPTDSNSGDALGTGACHRP